MSKAPILTSAVLLWLANAAVVMAQPAAIRPSIVIDSPVEGETTGGTVRIRFHVDGMTMGDPRFASPDAADVSKTGHVHVRVDGNSWVWLHVSNDPVSIAGLPPGPHKVVLQLADMAHKPLETRSVTFTVAAPPS